MGLSCACADFDPSEHDFWWEPGGTAPAPAGCRCCECGAAIPPGETVQTIDHMEVYEPEGAPRPLWDYDAGEIKSEEEEERIEEALEAFQDAHGWDSDCERFVRLDRADYRCERCSDLAAAIEDLGYCMVPPGDLAAQHCEYVEQSGGHEVIWKRGRDGVLHPRSMTRWDFARRKAGELWRRACYFVRHGWRISLRYRVWFPVQAAVMTRLGYRYRYLRAPSVYGWTRER